MKTVATNAKGWSASEELRSALVELGFRSGMPSIERGSHNGRFWLFADDIKRMTKLFDKDGTVCIETPKRKYFITGDNSHDAMHCQFSVTTK